MCCGSTEDRDDVCSCPPLATPSPVRRRHGTDIASLGVERSDGMEYSHRGVTRRRFVTGVAAAGVLAGLPRLPAYARASGGQAARVAHGTPGAVTLDLLVRPERLALSAGSGTAIAIGGSVPAPLIELYEGHDARLRITNGLAEETSIHWHGILLPFAMDGVPGVSFPGIRPGETFEARFPLRQAGTYWYHSHSGLQEQSGAYGPLVVHAREPEPYTYDRDYVVMLSDWTFEDPERVLANLRAMGGYYDYQKRTLVEFFRDASRQGLGAALSDRLAWGAMRMSRTDIADVTGATYTYLMNGMDAAGNWTGRFARGERVRLRLINGSAMSFFNLRIPELPMTVVAADGQDVQPVETDEIQIGVAETYDVIVAPDDRAYTIFAESLDRSGYVRGTLAPRAGESAAIPRLRERPLRSMVDMGMDMAAHGDAAHAGHAEPVAGPVVARHGPDHHGVANASVAEIQRDRLGERGIGLEDVLHRVLVYTDLRSAVPRPERPPGRELELHLTGNMERYMWSFDGQRYTEVDGQIDFRLGERLRLILVNDTMMEHPIHLHGMWMELENGHGAHIPRKHTLSVKPAERLSVLIDADAPGPWAFHCHLLYHMEMGMFRVVRVA
jgi:FtsP/CotA-like multicopper oxidase with cupredoxin domain